MFIGHFAVAYGVKRAAPRISLGTLFLSAQLIDLLWPLFLLLGLEHVRIDPGNTVVTPIDFYDYPFTHSLLSALGWSVAAGIVYYLARRQRNNAGIIGLLVFSHWILDFITHRPDLPLGWGQGVYFGLGLWNSLAGTLALEAGLAIAGIWLYLKSTRAKDPIGSYGTWGLIAVLSLIYLSNLFAPPPPGEEVVAIAGSLTWLFVIWAYWADRHRTSAAPALPEVAP